MSRPKGNRNKNPIAAPFTVSLTTEQRLEFLANIIVDRIVEDQASGQVLLERLQGGPV